MGTGHEMKKLLEKYNCFHDGILKAIEVSSADKFVGESHSLEITGNFKAVLYLVHYNYKDNTARKAVRFKLELAGVGPFLLHSYGEKDTPNDWSLNKIDVSPVKSKPGKWLLELHGNRYNVKSGKWRRVRLGVIEFSTYTFVEV